MPSPRQEALLPTAALLLACVGAWFVPQLFTPLKVAIVPALGLIMFGMGLTLTGPQLTAVLRRPRWLMLGIGLQFLTMPALAWGLDRGEPLRARITRLEPHPNPARRVRFEVYVE